MAQQSLSEYLEGQEDAERERQKEIQAAIKGMEEDLDSENNNVVAETESSTFGQPLTQPMVTDPGQQRQIIVSLPRETDRQIDVSNDPCLSSTMSRSPATELVGHSEPTKSAENVSENQKVKKVLQFSDVVKSSMSGQDDESDFELTAEQEKQIREDSSLEQQPNDVVIESIHEEKLENTGDKSQSEPGPSTSGENQSPRKLDLLEEGAACAPSPEIKLREKGSLDDKPLPVKPPPLDKELLKRVRSKSAKHPYEALFAPYVDTNMNIPIEARGENLLGLIEMVVRHKIMELKGWNPSRIKKTSINDMIWFNSRGSPLSQWHQKKMTIDGIEYCCSEQYMMRQKALLFDCRHLASSIMLTDNPSSHKTMGRQIGKSRDDETKFDQQIWDDNKIRIVYEATWAKFSQNDDYTEYLIGTHPKLLIETSKDSVWGIGTSFSATMSAYLPQGKGLLYGRDRPKKEKAGKFHLPPLSRCNDDHELPEIRKIASLAKKRPCGAALQRYFPGNKCVRDMMGPAEGADTEALRVTVVAIYWDGSRKVFIMEKPVKLIYTKPYYDEIDLTVPITYSAEDDQIMQDAIIRAKRARDFLPYTGMWTPGERDPYEKYAKVYIDSPVHYINNELYQDYEVYEDVGELPYDPNHEERVRATIDMSPTFYSLEEQRTYDKTTDLCIGVTQFSFNPDSEESWKKVKAVGSGMSSGKILSATQQNLMAKVRENRKEHQPLEEEIDHRQLHVGVERCTRDENSRRCDSLITEAGLVPVGYLPTHTDDEVDLTDIFDLTLDKYNVAFRHSCVNQYRKSATEIRLDQCSDTQQIALLRCYVEELKTLPETYLIQHLLSDGGEKRNGQRDMLNMHVFYIGGPCPLSGHLRGLEKVPDQLKKLENSILGCHCPIKYFMTMEEFIGHWYMYHSGNFMGKVYCHLPNPQLENATKGKNHQQLCCYKSGRNTDFVKHLNNCHDMGNVNISDMKHLRDFYCINLPSLPKNLITRPDIHYQVLDSNNKAVSKYHIACWVNMDPTLPDPRQGKIHVPRSETQEWRDCIKYNLGSLEALAAYKLKKSSLRQVRRDSTDSQTSDSGRKSYKRSRSKSAGSASSAKKLIVQAEGKPVSTDKTDDKQESTKPVKVEKTDKKTPKKKSVEKKGSVTTTTSSSSPPPPDEMSGLETEQMGEADINAPPEDAGGGGNGSSESAEPPPQPPSSPGGGHDGYRRDPPKSKEEYENYYLTGDTKLKLIKKTRNNPEPFDAPYWEWLAFIHKGSVTDNIDQITLVKSYIKKCRRQILRLNDLIYWGWFKNQPVVEEHIKSMIQAYGNDIGTLSVSWNVYNEQKKRAELNFDDDVEESRGMTVGGYTKHYRAIMDSKHYFLIPHYKESAEDLVRLAQVFIEEHKTLTREVKKDLIDLETMRDKKTTNFSEILTTADKQRVMWGNYLRWEAQFETFSHIEGWHEIYSVKARKKLKMPKFCFIRYSEPCAVHKLMLFGVTDRWKNYFLTPVATNLKATLGKNEVVLTVLQQHLREKQRQAEMTAQAAAESAENPITVDETDTDSDVTMTTDRPPGFPANLPPGFAQGAQEMAKLVSSIDVSRPPPPLSELHQFQPELDSSPDPPKKEAAAMVGPTTSGATPTSSTGQGVVDTAKSVAKSKAEGYQPEWLIPGEEQFEREEREKWQAMRPKDSVFEESDSPFKIEGIQLRNEYILPGDPESGGGDGVQKKKRKLDMKSNRHLLHNEIDIDTMRESMATFSTPLSVQPRQMDPEKLAAYRSEKSTDSDFLEYEGLMDEGECVRVPVDNEMRRLRARSSSKFYETLHADDLAVRNTYVMNGLRDLTTNTLAATTKRVQIDAVRIERLENEISYHKQNSANKDTVINEQATQINQLKNDLQKIGVDLRVEKTHIREFEEQTKSLRASLDAEREQAKGLLKNTQDSNKECFDNKMTIKELTTENERLTNKNNGLEKHITLISKQNLDLEKELKNAKSAAMPVALQKPPETMVSSSQEAKDSHPPPISLENLEPLDNWSAGLKSAVKRKFGWVDPARLSAPDPDVKFYRHKELPTHIVSMDTNGVFFHKLPTTEEKSSKLEANLKTRASSFTMDKVRAMRQELSSHD